MRITSTVLQSLIEPSGGRPSTHLQRVIDPLRLRLLLEVDRLGSITRAAEACSVAQPTASLHLRTLEAAVGHRLFERAARGTQLTDTGRVLARHAALVLSVLEALEDELAALQSAMTGTLRLAACDGFGTYVLPALLGAFAAERPHAQIQAGILPSAEVVRAAARGDVHVGIAGESPRQAGVVAERLLREELVWIAPGRNARLGSDDGAAAPDLEQQALVVQGPQSGTRALTDQLLRRLGRAPARTLELPSLEAVKRAVACGSGIALVSSMAVAAEFASGSLREVEIEGVPPLQRWIELVRAEDHRPSPLERLFEQALRRQCTPVGTGAADVAA